MSETVRDGDRWEESGGVKRNHLVIRTEDKGLYFFNKSERVFDDVGVFLNEWLEDLIKEGG